MEIYTEVWKVIWALWKLAVACSQTRKFELQLNKLNWTEIQLLRHGLDDCRIRVQFMAGTEIFLFSVPARLPLMPTLHPLQRLVGVWEAYYSPSSNSEVKNAWRFTCIPLLSSWHCAEWSMGMSFYFYPLIELCWTYTLRGLCRIASTTLLGITVNFVQLVIMEMQHKDHHLIAWSVLVLYQFHPTSKWLCLTIVLCL
jgi:hypothetical protein